MEEHCRFNLENELYTLTLAYRMAYNHLMGYRCDHGIIDNEMDNMQSLDEVSEKDAEGFGIDGGILVEVHVLFECLKDFNAMVALLHKYNLELYIGLNRITEETQFIEVSQIQNRPQHDNTVFIPYTPSRTLMEYICGM